MKYVRIPKHQWMTWKIGNINKDNIPIQFPWVLIWGLVNNCRIAIGSTHLPISIPIKIMTPFLIPITLPFFFLLIILQFSLSATISTIETIPCSIMKTCMLISSFTVFIIAPRAIPLSRPVIVPLSVPVMIIVPFTTSFPTPLYMRSDIFSSEIWFSTSTRYSIYSYNSTINSL